MIQINFLEDKIVEDIDSSKTILQISLQNEIPMIHACGGNARCSTCRVLILDGLENALPRNEAEKELADKKSLEDNIRLSCQTKISGNIKLKRLVIDEEDIEIAVSHNGVTGREEKIAVMFTDIRGFTSFSEKSLPYS
jgi:adenylate cyclase